MITCKEFGTLPSGELVRIYRICNMKGEYVELLDYGATIHAIYVADRNGNISDVVLGAPVGSDLTKCGVLGSTIGRCANRIAHGRYEVDGKVYQLETNRGGHFLHGASGNYAKKMFDASIDETENTVTFSLLDTGAGGFDCNVWAHISYKFTDDSVLTMTTRMIPDGTTVLNPTNHTYFNLGISDVRSLQLKLRANYRVSRDCDGLPDGGRIAVAGTSADFTRGRTLSDAMENDPTNYFADAVPGYDEFYFLEQKPGLPAAELYCPENGRLMHIVTDMPSMVLFVNGTRKDMPGKTGGVYSGYCAVCLEPGFVPNAVNCEQFDSPIYRQGESLCSVTRYIFTVDTVL